MKYLLAAALTILAFGLAACDAPTVVDDSTITGKVKSKLALDTRTSALKVGVETVNGVVTLTGTVPAESEKTAAAEVAKMTEGVKNVMNNVVIDTTSIGASNVGQKSEEGMKDAASAIGDAGVLAKIKTKFVAEGIIGTNVDVKDGVATLNGTVEDASEKTRAAQIAKDTDGVKSVKNMLTVQKKK